MRASEARSRTTSTLNGVRTIRLASSPVTSSARIVV
jgi:hypothetical protein